MIALAGMCHVIKNVERWDKDEELKEFQTG
jgi:hypothetical protein